MKEARVWESTLARGGGYRALVKLGMVLGAMQLQAVTVTCMVGSGCKTARNRNGRPRHLVVARTLGCT